MDRFYLVGKVNGDFSVLDILDNSIEILDKTTLFEYAQTVNILGVNTEIRSIDLYWWREWVKTACGFGFIIEGNDVIITDKDSPFAFLSSNFMLKTGDNYNVLPVECLNWVFCYGDFYNFNPKDGVVAGTFDSSSFYDYRSVRYINWAEHIYIEDKYFVLDFNFDGNDKYLYFNCNQLVLKKFDSDIILGLDLNNVKYVCFTKKFDFSCWGNHYKGVKYYVFENKGVLSKMMTLGYLRGSNALIAIGNPYGDVSKYDYKPLDSFMNNR